MNRAIKLLAIAALAGASTVSVAADKVGGYMDLGLGLGSQSADFWGDTGTGIGGKIAVGYRFNEHFAAEAGFAGASASMSPEGIDLDIDDTTSTFYGALVGYYPLSESLEVFGRFGFGSTSTTSTLSNGDAEVELESDSDVGPVFGAGVAFYTSPTTAFTVEFNRLSSDKSGEISGDNVGPNGLNLFSAGFVLRF